MECQEIFTKVSELYVIFIIVWHAQKTKKHYLARGLTAILPSAMKRTFTLGVLALLLLGQGASGAQDNRLAGIGERDPRGVRHDSRGADFSLPLLARPQGVVVLADKLGHGADRLPWGKQIL